VLNKDGYLYHSQQEGRSKQITDPYKLARQALLRQEARRAIAQVLIPPLSPLPNRRKRASKKQKQLDQEAEEERQDQYQRRYREALVEEKYLELKEAERQREEVEKQAQGELLERFRRRFA
jgi:hypothetical protein